VNLALMFFSSTDWLPSYSDNELQAFLNKVADGEIEDVAGAELFAADSTCPALAAGLPLQFFPQDTVRPLRVLSGLQLTIAFSPDARSEASSCPRSSPKEQWNLHPSAP
jgi:hypothetical protein